MLNTRVMIQVRSHLDGFSNYAFSDIPVHRPLCVEFAALGVLHRTSNRWAGTIGYVQEREKNSIEQK
jgi:hypothetical protein